MKDCTVCTVTKRWEMVDVLFAGLSKERMEKANKGNYGWISSAAR